MSTNTRQLLGTTFYPILRRIFQKLVFLKECNVHGNVLGLSLIVLEDILEAAYMIFRKPFLPGAPLGQYESPDA